MKSRGHRSFYYLGVYLLVGMTALFFVSEYRRMFDPRLPTSFGVDFYHFWGVGEARSLTVLPLGSPWPQAHRYEKILERAANSSNDALQVAAQRHRRQMDLTSTPWTYTVFSILPSSYGAALYGFRWISLLLGLGSMVMLTKRWFGRPVAGWVVALLLAASFVPWRTDLRVGNTGLVILALFLGAVLLLEKHREASSVASWRPFVASGLVLSAVLLKPTWWWTLGALALHLGATLDSPARRKTLWGLIGLSGLFFLLPILYFADFGIWMAWLDSVILAGGQRLDYAIDAGNFSSLKLGARELGWAGSGFATLVLWLLPLLWVLRQPRLLSRRLRDPGVAMGLGITVSLALSPLCWVHYFLQLILPAGVLLRCPRWGARILAVAGIALTAGWVDGWLAPTAWGRSTIPWLFGLAWLPLGWGLWFFGGHRPHEGPESKELEVGLLSDPE